MMSLGLLKIVASLASPSNLVLVLGVVGLVLLFTRFSHFGRRLLIIGYLIFVIIGITPLAHVLILPLEERFPSWDASRGTPSGIIVLGGAIDAELSALRGEVSLSDAAERLTSIAELARRYPTAKIVFSGGSERSTPSEADLAIKLFESFGVLPERLLYEDRSLNTFENALFSKLLINPNPSERWLLVTSAAHMSRAIGAFRKVGFQVEAYPVDWRTGGYKELLSFFGSPLARLNLCDVAIHEWLGLFVYWLNGQSSALFPEP
jgi:uncharacterized SAM-binding protein YcdF (DUF218 family)